MPAPPPLTTASSGTQPPFVADWNNDSCVDAIWNFTIWISGCDGSVGASQSITGTPLVVMDWDGDGRSDLLTANGSTMGAYLSDRPWCHDNSYQLGPVQFNVPLLCHGRRWRRIERSRMLESQRLNAGILLSPQRRRSATGSHESRLQMGSEIRRVQPTPRWFVRITKILPMPLTAIRIILVHCTLSAKSYSPTRAARRAAHIFRHSRTPTRG